MNVEEVEEVVGEVQAMSATLSGLVLEPGPRNSTTQSRPSYLPSAPAQRTFLRHGDYLHSLLLSALEPLVVEFLNTHSKI